MQLTLLSKVSSSVSSVSRRLVPLLFLIVLIVAGSVPMWAQGGGEEELKLPDLTPKVPWFGYELGYWPDSWDKATKLTLEGRYLETGETLKSQRTKSSYYDTGIVGPPAEVQL